MVSLLVVQIIKYRFGVPVVAMLSRINVMYKSPACAERTRFSVLGNGNSAPRSPCVRSAHEGDLYRCTANYVS